MFYRHTTLILLLSLTALYLLSLTFISAPGSFILTATYFIGMFVPAGIWSSLKSFGIAPVVAVISAFYLDRYMDTRAFSHVEKILIAVFALFIITMLFDFVLWQRWNSMYLLFTMIRNPSFF